MKHAFAGGCHCGAVRLLYASEVAPEEAEIRACQCDFCRRQGSEAISDPSGSLEIRAAAEAVRRYRFGHGQADYLSCAHCGTYLGAVTETAEELKGFILVRALDERDRFTGRRVAADFEGEGLGERQARRAARWTPATFRSD